MNTPRHPFIEAALSPERPNIFLTGQAGTGKSTLVRQLRDLLGDREENITVVAPTGIAALTIEGQTLHRFTGIGLGPKGRISNEDWLAAALRDPLSGIRRGMYRMRYCNRVLIDEISMLNGRTFSLAEWLFRKAKDDCRPWGGAQAIGVGDFLQLAPVQEERGQPHDWAFKTDTWAASQFKNTVLKEIYRQDDPEFIHALNGLRTGNLTQEDSDFLWARVVDGDPAKLDKTIPRIFTKNNMVDAWNEARMAELPGKAETFIGRRGGNPRTAETLAKAMTTPELLTLKVGARIMMTNNDPGDAWVNGSMGTLTSMSPDRLGARLDCGWDVEFERHTWRLGDGDYRGTVTQFPVRPAYAVTIHKSQGVTLDAAVVDAQASWEPGQVYVACSRVRRPAGLHLSSWFDRLVISPEVKAFVEGLR